MKISGVQVKYSINGERIKISSKKLQCQMPMDPKISKVVRDNPLTPYIIENR
jgi:hypothetical protein